MRSMRPTLLYVGFVAIVGSTLPEALSYYVPNRHVRDIKNYDRLHLCKAGNENCDVVDDFLEPSIYDHSNDELSIRSPTLPDDFPKELTHEVLKFATMKEKENQGAHRKKANEAKVAVNREHKVQVQVMTEGGRNWEKAYDDSQRRQEKHWEKYEDHVGADKQAGKTLTNVAMINKDMRKKMINTFARPRGQKKNGKKGDPPTGAKGQTNRKGRPKRVTASRVKGGGRLKKAGVSKPKGRGQPKKASSPAKSGGKPKSARGRQTKGKK